MSDDVRDEEVSGSDEAVLEDETEEESGEPGSPLKTVRTLVFIILVLSLVFNFLALASNRSLRTKLTLARREVQDSDQKIGDLDQVREVASRCINDVLFKFGRDTNVLATIQKYYPQAQRPPLPPGHDSKGPIVPAPGPSTSHSRNGYAEPRRGRSDRPARNDQRPPGGRAPA